VLLDVIRDEAAAHDWLEALRAHGIPAELRFADGQRYSPLSSAYPIGPLFVYPLFVPAAERAAAARVLIDLGWDGRGRQRVTVGRARAIVGTALALGGGLGLGVLLLWRAQA